MPGRTALALGAVAGAFLVLVLYGMAKNDVLGGLDPARRTAWYLTGVLIGWCFAVDVGVGHGVYLDRYLAYGATVLAWLATGLLTGQVATALAAWAYAGGALLSLLTVTAAVDDSLWGVVCTATSRSAVRQEPSSAASRPQRTTSPSSPDSPSWPRSRPFEVA